jgi:site-specific recombinase XerD
VLPSWQLALRAERKSPATIRSYTEGVAGFLRWCEANGIDADPTKANAQAWVADILDNGNQPKTASARLLAMRRFSAWMAEEGEIETNELATMKQPKIDKKVVEALTEEQLRDLIKACRGTGFTDRRDEAIVRLMAETGMRTHEVLALQVADVDLQRGLATIRRGKGGKGRVVPFGSQAGQAIDRYIRARRSHRLVDSGTLWLGADAWRTFHYPGLRHTLQARAAKAGIANFHPHKMQHTAATRWLRACGSEGGLMAVGGWTRREMIDRYTGAAREELATTEARGLALGDL